MCRRDVLVLDNFDEASSGVGMVVPPMIKAVESGDGESNDEHLLESAGSAYATAGVVATANPTPSATANAPTRPTYFAVLIVGPPSMSGGRMATGSGGVPLWESSLPFGATSPVARYCNLARPRRGTT